MTNIFLICALALPPEPKVDRVHRMEDYVGLIIQPEDPEKAKKALADFVRFMIGRRSA